MVDSAVAYVKIHPSIGVARVGNSPEGYFYGPETPDEKPAAPGFYKDGNGAVKRQAARFRVYAYNAAGEVIEEITESADSGTTITWQAHLANKKAAWYQFHLALDIPDALDLKPSRFGRRNATVTGAERDKLVIDPGARTVQGRNHAAVPFDTGRIRDVPVYLGELRTDDAGRLVVLGGRGQSGSFTDPKTELTTFANNEGWYDDISDGPVTATVNIGGKEFTASPAWVLVAPPNYAPDLKSVRTVYDLLYDIFADNGWPISRPGRVSFVDDIIPILRRFCELQWVNHGFAAQFGWQAPNYFTEPETLAELASPDVQSRELRRQIYDAMRSYPRDGISPVPWPWIYGDGMAVPPHGDLQHMVLSPTQDWMLERWAVGDFDPQGHRVSRETLQSAPVAEQPALLDRAALDYCIADAFHPGCEVTWPIRHDTMYMEPFRILHRQPGQPEDDYGERLTPGKALSARGPLYAQGPGDLTRWMAVPWQTDAASCRSGYEYRANIGPRYSPYLPTFWPARVPNQVLKATDFDVVNEKVTPTPTEEQREESFERRAVWLRFLSPDKVQGLKDMVAGWYKLGIVEVRDYTVGDKKFPSRILVESTPDLSLPSVPDRQNLVNLHVPEAGDPARASGADAAISAAVDDVVSNTVFTAEEISAGYIERVDPHLESQ